MREEWKPVNTHHGTIPNLLISSYGKLRYEGERKTVRRTSKSYWGRFAVELPHSQHAYFIDELLAYTFFEDFDRETKFAVDSEGFFRQYNIQRLQIIDRYTRVAPLSGHIRVKFMFGGKFSMGFLFDRRWGAIKCPIDVAYNGVARIVPYITQPVGYTPAITIIRDEEEYKNATSEEVEIDTRYFLLN
jgi:hypothetical protein